MECIGKGKARSRYEFGVKTSIATINEKAKGGQLVVGSRIRANPGIFARARSFAVSSAQNIWQKGRRICKKDDMLDGVKDIY